MHELRDPEHRDPAQNPAGMQERKILARESLHAKEHDRERIAERQGRRRGGRGHQVLGTRLAQSAQIQHAVGSAPQRGVRMAGDRDDRDAPPPKRGQKAQELGRLAALRQENGPVPLRDDSQVSVNGVDRMDEVGGGAGAGQGGGDLLRHQAGLADPGCEYLPLDLEQELNGALEVLANALLEVEDRCPLGFQDLASPLRNVRRGSLLGREYVGCLIWVHAGRAPTSDSSASDCLTLTKLRSRPRSSERGHWLSRSDRARAGSGWVSMKMPSTPAAIAALPRTGMNSRWPKVSGPPCRCTEWVASKKTGQPNRFMISMPRKSTTRSP